MNDEELLDGLARFGLTPYEIRVYRSLLIYGPQSSMDIVKSSAIPQPRVYDVCNTLVRKGFIEVSPGRKKMYRAVPISLSLRRQVDNLGTFVDDLEDHLDSLKNEKKSDVPYMWLIESEKNIVEKLANMISRSRDELIMSVSAEHLRLLYREITAAATRGVTIAMVVFSDTSDQEMGNLPKSVILKKREAKAAEIAISDRSAGIVNMSVVNKATQYAVFFEEDEMLHILGFYFLNVIWSPSQFVHGFTGVRTRSFRTGWLASEAIKSYLDEGVELMGDLEGMEKGSRVFISGKLVGSEQINGVKYSFFIKDGERTYSVGGKTASLEDIAMHRLSFTRAV